MTTTRHIITGRPKGLPALFQPSKTNKNMHELEGKHATLIIPYLGYRNIILVERSGCRWLVEICGPGRQIEVYEDEFILDRP